VLAREDKVSSDGGSINNTGVLYFENQMRAKFLC
jgi:hypothetical protein